MPAPSPRPQEPKVKDRLRSGDRVAGPAGAFEIISTDAKWKNFGMMLYGPPGIGKTWLAGTAVQVPALSPVLVIDNDGGSKTLQGKPQFKGIDIIRIHMYEAYNNVYEMLLENKKGYKTVVIDNLGALHTMAMAYEMEQVCKKDPSREANVPSQREYGIVRAMIHKLVRFYESLPMNLIVTAHAELDKDELTGVTRIRPAISGKLAYEVPGFLDINGYVTTERVATTPGGSPADKKIKRVVYFQPVRQIDAKDESDALGDVMEDPTMLKIAKAIGII
jgi:phage nucleotide-binding protein